MSVEDMIDALAVGDNLAAEEAFADEMRTRISDALDAKRIEIGQSVYGGQSPEEYEEE